MFDDDDLLSQNSVVGLRRHLMLITCIATADERRTNTDKKRWVTVGQCGV